MPQVSQYYQYLIFVHNFQRIANSELRLRNEDLIFACEHILAEKRECYKLLNNSIQSGRIQNISPSQPRKRKREESLERENSVKGIKQESLVIGTTGGIKIGSIVEIFC